MLLRLSLLLALLLAAPVTAQTAEPLPLGPLDQIEVNVASYPDLKTLTRIAADGSVILPLIGPVRIGGLSPADAANLIETRYVNGGFIKLPLVRVELTDIQSRKVSVLGEVNAQGLLPLDRSYSVAEILARAGGLGPEAADTAVLVRQQPAGAPPLRLTIDLGGLVAGGTGNTSALTPVGPGDVVFVPKAPTFSVTGAVGKPGTYRLIKGMTIDQGVAAAGDLSQFGTRSRLRVRRAGATGTTTLAVTLDDPIQPGDVLIVRERLF